MATPSFVRREHPNSRHRQLPRFEPAMAHYSNKYICKLGNKNELLVQTAGISAGAFTCNRDHQRHRFTANNQFRTADLSNQSQFYIAALADIYQHGGYSKHRSFSAGQCCRLFCLHTRTGACVCQHKHLKRLRWDFRDDLRNGRAAPGERRGPDNSRAVEARMATPIPREWSCRLNECLAKLCLEL